MQEIAPMKAKIPSNNSECHICEQPFHSTDVRVLDHCYKTFNDNIRGFSHVNCNLKLKTQKFLPCYFHHLRGYDLNFILKELNRNVGKKNKHYSSQHTEIFCLSNRRNKIHGHHAIFKCFPCNSRRNTQILRPQIFYLSFLFQKP